MNSTDETNRQAAQASQIATAATTGAAGAPCAAHQQDTPDDGIDDAAIRTAVRMYLKAIGEDPDRDGLLDTPDRIARASHELFAGLHSNPQQVLEKRFPVDTDEMVLVRDIELYSVCEHHLLPFHGVAHVGYIPSHGAVVGLSKLARLVDVYARRPQVQERLTQQIADALMEYADARGVIVVTECEHLCMSMRGVKNPKPAPRHRRFAES